MRDFFRNCLGVREEKDGFLPLRFTSRQMDFYAKNRDRRPRSLCPSGITLDFVTDATWVEWEYRIVERVRDWHFFDCFADGVMIGSYGSKTPAEGGRYRQVLTGKPSTRVTLHLPHLVHLVLTRLSFSPGAKTAPAPAPARTVLFMGDSITQGMSAEHPSSAYPALLSRQFDFGLINQGVGGWIYHPESLDEALKIKPDLVMAAYGSNDWYFSDTLSEIEENCALFFDRLVSIFPATPVLVMTPLWRADFEEARPAGTFNSMVETIEKVCKRHPSFHRVAGTSLFPHLSEYMRDGKLHPNDEGFALLALNLSREIRRLKIL